MTFLISRTSKTSAITSQDFFPTTTNSIIERIKETADSINWSASTQQVIFKPAVRQNQQKKLRHAETKGLHDCLNTLKRFQDQSFTELSDSLSQELRTLQKRFNIQRPKWETVRLTTNCNTLETVLTWLQKSLKSEHQANPWARSNLHKSSSQKRLAGVHRALNPLQNRPSSVQSSTWQYVKPSTNFGEALMGAHRGRIVLFQPEADKPDWAYYLKLGGTVLAVAGLAGLLFYFLRSKPTSLPNSTLTKPLQSAKSYHQKMKDDWNAVASKVGKYWTQQEHSENWLVRHGYVTQELLDYALSMKWMTKSHTGRYSGPAK